MTAVSNRLLVLFAGEDRNEFSLNRRALRGLSHFARVIPQPSGAQLFAYLRGEGRFANRDAAPLPDVLVLDSACPGISSLHVLCWLRGEPALARLPVVVLNASLSRSETELIRRLHAACCTPVPDVRQMAEALEESICNALGLAWDASLSRSNAALGESCFASYSDPEAIRVWT